jgi:futalosine hydrolase
MKILLAAATKDEIALFSGKDIDVLITGVGVPSALYHLQKRLQQMDYDMVIQAGFAGAYDRGLQLGDTVLVHRDTFGDIGMGENHSYHSIFETPLADKNEFPFSDGWLVNDNEWIGRLNYKNVNSITVNTVSDDELLKQQRIHVYNPAIESMEGAALHYVCLQESVPFLQIRTISNYAGIRDKAQWKMKESVENLDTGIRDLIKQLND